MNADLTFSRTARKGMASAFVLLSVLLFPSGLHVAASPRTVGQAVTAADLWLVPAETRDVPQLGQAVADLAAGHANDVLKVFAKATSDPLLGGYARLYLGRAEFALKRYPQAVASARVIVGAAPSGYLGEAALWLLADAAEAAGDWKTATTALQALSDISSSNPALAYRRLGRAAARVADAELAQKSFAKLHYDFPLSPEAEEARTEIAPYVKSVTLGTFEMELARAQLLYNGRRYADAKKAYEVLRTQASSEKRALVDLRVAQCDFFLQRYAPARDALRIYLDTVTTGIPEARYYLLSATRGLGRGEEFVTLARSFLADYPTSALAEVVLNDMGTYYILANDDATAASVFAGMYRRFPLGAFADRAAWKSGWWAYKTGNDDEAVQTFESAAANFTRADLRPSWLYWAGRAHARQGRLAAAIADYNVVLADYRNSYYGRQASRQVAEIVPRLPATVSLAATTKVEGTRRVVAGTPPPNARLIERMMAAGLYDDAVVELRKAQQQSGTSPYVEATIAYALNRKGELRPAITTMRRAYPEFMADGGEALPADILKVIFPLDYWGLIRKYASQHDLDPYLIAALVAQESTFQADVKSVADAWGLMQILPSTGRRYATRVGVRRFSTAQLTNPEVNVRIGTAYFADLMNQFNDVASALAAYNAGETRVARWRADRPGVPRDEFIDDIPFPETQNYVKRIIGTAEDYRRLYSPASASIVRETSR